MTTYSPALASEVGSLMSQLVPGLSKNLATAWATLESGVNNNPYGMTSPTATPTGGASYTTPIKNSDGSTTYLNGYRTLAAGVQAAANNLLTNPVYSSIRAALRTSDPNAVASALVASEWNTPNSAYYANGFTAAGFHIDLSSVPVAVGSSNPGTSKPSDATFTSYTTPGSSSSSGSSAGAVAGSLTDWFTQGSPTTSLTSAMVQAILGDVPVDNPNRSQIQATLTSAIGTPINQIGFNASWFNSPTGGLKPLTYLFPPLGQAIDTATQALGSVGSGLFGSLFAWVPQAGVSLGILAVVVVLGFMGVQRLLPET